MREITSVRVWPSPDVVDVHLQGVEGGSPVDAAGAWLVPSFVDLACDPGFPGFPVREDAISLGAAALAGGFTELLTDPAQDPVLDRPEHFAQLRRATPQGVRLWPAAAVTRRLEGGALVEVGLLARAGVVALSDGRRALADTVVLRNAMEYARAFGMPLLLRPCDPFLDELGVVHEGPLAAQIGLRGNPAANEEIGVARVIALVRATGARVHLAPLSTARGVALVRAARAEGLPVSAAVAARSLVLTEEALADGRYDTRYRLVPPLRAAEDRDALRAAVRDGTAWICADHAPRAPEEKELEFERAVPGSTGLESAFAAALTALEGDLDRVVEALALGPRRLLPEATGGLALVDVDSAAVVDVAGHRSRARNDALHGQSLRGAVRATFPHARVGGGS